MRPVYNSDSNHPVVGCTNYLLQNSHKKHSYSELQPNVQKRIMICCCNFNKILITRKTLLQENFNLTINFDLMITFELFDLITLEWLMVLMRSESPSGMCAKLRTVAASSNRDDAPQSLSAYLSHQVQSSTR